MRIPQLLLCSTFITATAFADQPADINYSAYANCDPATKALVAKVLAGFGGAEKLRGIQSVRKLANIEEKTPRGDLKTEFEGVAVFPRSLYARMQLAQVEVRAVSTPDKAFVYQSNATVKGAAMRLNDTEKTTLGRYFYEEPFLVVRNRIDPGQLVAIGPKVKVNGRDAEALYVHLEGLDIEWDVDSESGRVVRTRVGKKTTDYTDFKDVNGVILPHTLTSSIDGKTSSVTRYRRYDLNPQLDTKAMFQTPTLWATRNPTPTLGRARDGWWNRGGKSFGSYDYQYSSEYGRGSRSNSSSSYNSNYYDAYSSGYGSVSSYVFVLYTDYY